MGKLAKISLVLMIINGVAAALFLTGVIDVSKEPGFYVTFPVAVVLYGMFVIFCVFEKDAVKFDAEQRKHHKDIKADAKPDIQPRNVEPLHDHKHDHDKSIAA